MWPFWLGIPLMIGSFMGLVMLIFSIFWIWMLIDVIKRDFKDPNERLIWVLVIIFTHLIGAILYYLLVKQKGRR